MDEFTPRLKDTLPILLAPPARGPYLLNIFFKKNQTKSKIEKTTNPKTRTADFEDWTGRRDDSSPKISRDKAGTKRTNTDPTVRPLHTPTRVLQISNS